MTKIWLKLQLHFSQKTTTKTKLKSAVKINTAVQGFNTKTYTMNGKNWIPDFLADLEMLCIFLGPKRGHVWGKEDVWSP